MRDSSTPPHFQAWPRPRFTSLSNIHHENASPSGSPQEDCELLHPDCLEKNLALLGSTFLQAFSPIQLWLMHQRSFLLADLLLFHLLFLCALVRNMGETMLNSVSSTPSS